VVSSVVSLASVVSYPALLALGLPPVVANVTNTVSLCFSSLGSLIGCRKDLRGQYRRAAAMGGLTVAGGVAGAALLLSTPASAFESAVPWLIGFGAVAIMAQPYMRDLSASSSRLVRYLLVVAAFAVAVYVGYFGAAGGVLMVAVLGVMFDDSLQRINALKNVAAGVANTVAAVTFTAFGPVDWSAVPALALGFFVGGWGGAALARRIPAAVLRPMIAACGSGVAVWLAVR
jgi:uncharacterized protein